MYRLIKDAQNISVIISTASEENYLLLLHFHLLHLHFGTTTDQVNYLFHLLFFSLQFVLIMIQCMHSKQKVSKS